MVIRDMDMYGKGVVESVPGLAVSRQIYPYQGIQVAGNRGASGIDGLLSSAVGFSVGCKKRVSIILSSYLIHCLSACIYNEVYVSESILQSAHFVGVCYYSVLQYIVCATMLYLGLLI